MKNLEGVVRFIYNVKARNNHEFSYLFLYILCTYGKEMVMKYIFECIHMINV